MNHDEGRINFGIALDNTKLQADADKASKILSNIDKEAAKQSESVRELLTNIPKVEVMADFGDLNIDKVLAAFDNLEAVRTSNENGIKSLKEAYRALGEEIEEAKQNPYVNNEESKRIAARIQELYKERHAIRECIKERRSVLREVEKEGNHLDKLFAKYKKKEEAEKKSANATVSLRTETRLLTEELIRMEADGLRGTEVYEQKLQRLATLTDAMGDARAQANALAHDQKGFQGIISGLQGVTGAFTAAQGAIALFAGENEDLQRIMTKVQGLMAITMGLQQVQQTLNKDSAFSLVTLNAIKKQWNRLLGDSAKAQEQEKEATEENNAAQEGSAAANAQAATAKGQNTQATLQQSAANSREAATQGSATQATEGHTVATRSATLATRAQAAATKVLNFSLKALKAALISTGIGAVIAGIGILAAKLYEYATQASEARKAQRELNKELRNASIEARKAANEAYGKAAAEVGVYQRRLKNFNGTKKQEAALIKELNGQYGRELGFFRSRSEWLTRLTQKGKAYIDMLKKQQEVQGFINLYAKSYTEGMAAEAQLKAEDKARKKGYGLLDDDEYKRLQQELNKNKRLKRFAAELIDKKQRELDKHIAKNDFGGYEDNTARGDKAINERKQNVAKLKNSLREYENVYKEFLDANRKANETFARQEMESQEKRELALLELSAKRQKEMIQKSGNGLVEVYREVNKNAYLSQGKSEEQWQKTALASEDDNATFKRILKERGELAKAYNEQLLNVDIETANKREEIRRRYYAQWVNEFGSVEERLVLLNDKYKEKLNEAPESFRDAIRKEWQAAVSQLKSEELKDSIQWESVFGDLSKQPLSVLEKTLARIREYFSANKGQMGTQEIKDFSEAIAKMEGEIDQRNPFTALHNALEAITESSKELKRSEEELKTATEEHADAQARLTQLQEEYNALKAREKENGADLTEQKESLYKEVEQAEAHNVQTKKKQTEAEKAHFAALQQSATSYKRLEGAMKGAMTITKELGNYSATIAKIFRADIAESISAAVDTFEVLIENTDQVMRTIADAGEGVIGGIVKSVQAASVGTTAAATVAAGAIGIVEKASVVLTIISAALQVGAAIKAWIDSNQDDPFDSIDALQKRIEELRFKRTHLGAEELERAMGSVSSNLKIITNDIRQSVMSYRESMDLLDGVDFLVANRYQLKGIEEQVVQTRALKQITEQLARAYAQVQYATGRLFGLERYQSTKKILELHAEELILMQQEADKLEALSKNPHRSDEEREKALERYKKLQEEIKEKAYEMARTVIDAFEDIMGGSAEHIANELGNAFFEAAQAGEAAFEAMGRKVDDIVATLIKKLLIQEVLTPQIVKIFERYKQEWFKDGEFQGAEKVRETANSLAAELKQTGVELSLLLGSLPDDIRKLIGVGNLKKPESIIDSIFDTLTPDDADEKKDERQGEKKGIATASQDSIDELNGRMVAVQTHTFKISEHTQQLAATAGLILKSVVNIEGETYGINDRLTRIESHVGALNRSVQDITTKGLRIQ